MNFEKESEYDNREYKQHINYLDKEKLEHYTTQLNYRLLIGSGKCYFYLGISDWGDFNGLSFHNCLKSFKNF